MSAAALAGPLLAALLLLAPAAGPSDEQAWRWQSRWALAELLDVARVEEPPGSAFARELSVRRAGPGVPPAWRGATLRVTGDGLQLEDRLGRGRPIVELRGEPAPSLLGVARGPTGLLLLAEDDRLGGRAVLELRYRPAFEYPFRIGHGPRVVDEVDARGHAAMVEAGCFACHSLHGRRQVGPSLDRETLVPRLRERLFSAEYERRLAELDSVEGWGIARWREARAEILAAQGDERLQRWMRRHLTEPAFDEPQARMPPPGLTAQQLEAVGAFLLREPER